VWGTEQTPLRIDSEEHAEGFAKEQDRYQPMLGVGPSIFYILYLQRERTNASR
jgi:hypothetical protein